MFLDLHTITLFGNENQVLAAIPSHDIHSKEPKTVTKYVNDKFPTSTLFATTLPGLSILLHLAAPP
jgi:hypothetical protein